MRIQPFLISLTEAAEGAIASGNTAASATTSGGSAVSAATSGDIIAGATVSRVSVVVYEAQIHHKAIPNVGSVTDRGISSGTGRFESAGLGITAARADTSGGSSMLDASLEY